MCVHGYNKDVGSFSLFFSGEGGDGVAKGISSYSNKSGHRINTAGIGRDGKENRRY